MGIGQVRAPALPALGGQIMVQRLVLGLAVVVPAGQHQQGRAVDGVQHRGRRAGPVRAIAGNRVGFGVVGGGMHATMVGWRLGVRCQAGGMLRVEQASNAHRGRQVSAEWPE